MVVLGLTILLLCQLAGEIVSRGTALPVPGPVIGLVILVAALALWDRGREKGAGMVAPAAAVTQVGDALLANLALLFVPAGVGVIQYGALLKAQAVPLALALVGSTAATLVATVLTFAGVSRLLGRPAADEARREAP